MANNLQIAKDILPLVGEKDNIQQALHCMTRLRLNLKDNTKADVDALKKVDGVVGCQFSGDQLQIIIGTNVSKVYEEFLGITGLNSNAAIEENLDEEKPKKKKGKGGVVDAIFGYISASMTPVLPVLIIAGLTKTIVAIFGPSVLGVIAEDSDLYTLFTFVGDAGMYFLPFFLAVGAAKKLNSNWGIAMYLAAIMLHPTFIDMATNGTSFTVYGIPCSVQNYSSTVMPILLAVWIMSYIEHFIKKHCPDALQIIAVPFLTALIMTPITLCVLGPIGSFASNYICGGIIKLYDIAGPLATMVIGALFLPIVFTGMHGVLYVYLFTTFPTLGYDSFFLPGVVASSWAIAGTVLATLVKFKKKSNRSFTISGFITWLVGGVGEPLMYGLLLRYRQLLYSCIISGGIAGLVAGLLHLTAYVLAPNNGIYGLFAFLGGPTSNYVALIITLAVAIGTSFAITMFMKIDEDAA